MKAKLVYESTGNYWPGYSDDGTADNLADIRKKTSKIQNDELKKKKKEVLSNNYSDDNGPSAEDKKEFFQKWMYANMILTSLQDGFYIKKELLDEALVLYSEIIADSQIDEYLKDSKNPDYFIQTIGVILSKLQEKVETNGKGEVYAPGFLDKDDEDRIKIDQKFGKY